MNEQPDILSAIPELEGDIPATRFIEGALWIPALVLLGLVVILIAALLIWRMRKKPLPAPPTQESVALAELAHLEQDLPALRECSLRLSLIMRQFLTGQTQDPALFETHEEFSQRYDALANVPEQYQYDTRFLLEGLADLKYSGNTTHDPMRARQYIEQARSLITNIAEAQRMQAAAQSAEGK